MTKQLTTILQKDMSRKEFLMTLGLASASLFGFSTIISMLTGKSVGTMFNHRVTSGYGSSRYGM
jgi:hypothetical protein